MALDNLLPHHFTLHQNFPNPFNPTTRIRFEIPKPSHTILTIYDLLGREVATLMNGSIEPGYYEVIRDGRNMHGKCASSRIYFYQLTADYFRATRKIILLS